MGEDEDGIDEYGDGDGRCRNESVEGGRKGE
jgi:hypothetical protein